VVWARQVGFIAVASHPGQYPNTGLPEVAFAGRSNVGKSSLINALVGRKGLARISQVPGKTRLIHFYQVERLFVLVDLPGYGYARVPEAVRKAWRPMVEAYLAGRKELRLVVLLLDIRRIPAETDLQLKGWLQARGIPFLTVATKLDKLSRGQAKQRLREIAKKMDVSPEEILGFSSVTGEGKRELRSAIFGFLSNPQGAGDLFTLDRERGVD
jgi:GTP-binding protein